mmetsp:Transcript_7732/g.7158  ORF Transcript_7732/g.7158 Transcript_7732/m.7158 type:complete len:98 (-) Transcript_7732:1665-1958(-)
MSNIMNDKSMESYDIPINYEERKAIQQSSNIFNQANFVKLDKYEAKTILYGAKTLRILVEENMSSYLEKSLIFRNNLFKQFMRVLDISLAVQIAYRQ